VRRGATARRTYDHERVASAFGPGEDVFRRLRGWHVTHVTDGEQQRMCASCRQEAQEREKRTGVALR
jgi:hypothetical protein